MNLSTHVFGVSTCSVRLMSMRHVYGIGSTFLPRGHKFSVSVTGVVTSTSTTSLIAPYNENVKSVQNSPGVQKSHGLWYYT